MPTPLFVFAADLHLQTRAWKNRPEIAGDAIFSFAQIADYCLRHELPLVLGGDIFDQRRPDPASVHAFLEELGRMNFAGLSCRFVQGDHCFSSTVAWPVLSYNAMPLHGLATGLIGPLHNHDADATIAGLDWTPMNLLKGALEQLGRDWPTPPEILVTHEAWRELQGIGSVEGSLDDIPFPCLLLTGDYHGYVDKIHEGPHGRIRVVSPGSTAMQAIDEAPDKCFVVVQRNDDGTLDVVKHQLFTRYKADFRVESLAEIGPIVRWAQLVGLDVQERFAELARTSTDVRPPSDFKPLVRVMYPETLTDLQPVLNSAIGELAHIFWNPQSVAPPDVLIDMEAAPATAFDDLVSAVGQLSEPGSPEHDGTCRLLRCRGDLDAELVAMRQEFLDPPTGS